VNRRTDLEAMEWGPAERYVLPISDEDLALAALHDARRFETLYERYADRLYRYALSRTGSPEAAADIVSATMVAALERLERFDPAKGTLSAWLFTIAGHRIADRRRAYHRFRRYLSTLRQAGVPAEDSPLELIDRDEDRIAVRAAVERLSDNHREVILLRYVAELHIAEIAAALGITEAAVKMRLNRAMKHLADDLGGDHDD
jgi:RNA polymerase sigma-70 factor (ECF subfamily)